MKRSDLLAVLFTFIGILCHAQSSYHYARQIPAPTGKGWYGINLPSEIFKHIKSDYGDIRIFKVTKKDTTEIPYIIRIREASAEVNTIPVKQLNKSTRDGKLFITFELPKGETIDHIQFNFKEKNFDEMVTLEGSHDQKEWFTLAENERIAALDKNGMQFNYNEVLVPSTNYRYLRATISGTPVTFVDASLTSTKLVTGFHHHVAHRWKATDLKTARQSVVEIKFKYEEPINFINIDIEHSADFYRNYTLEVLIDSAKTDKGIRYYYNTLTTGYITSIKSNNINFELTKARQLKLTVFNEDNAPLEIKSISASRPEVTLASQLEPNQDYYLFYGDEFGTAPAYDIVHFEKNIPDTLPTLELQDEIALKQDVVETKTPLFQNPVWLWSIMGIMILVLGFFTMKMMKNK
ncbi:DUF3999 family protein [Pseudochryseolinea flava]|uniref:DUF3999 domain-containing protein n=1 Tax=Pseudochryseolinea flava TaxID=2059302 RepID=A0A364Y719_9BACT|nr:DUF3999 family protein [Pseudochryseolinea flava]RAW01634.1 hypothetical protein DQQ10_08235 [Pseudochryseolinea flava]